MLQILARRLIDMRVFSAQSLEDIVDDRGRNETNEHAEQQVERIMNAEIEARIAYHECPKYHESRQNMASEEIDDEESKRPTVGGMSRRATEVTTPIAVYDVNERADRVM